MKLETIPEVDLNEAVFLVSKSFSLNINENSSNLKYRGDQDDN